MATRILHSDKAGKRLFNLLAKAAGVDGKLVRSLECRVAVKECVTFAVEFYADEAEVERALEEGTEEG